MQHDCGKKLEKLGFKRPDWCLPSTEALVRTFEKQFSLKLPADYREFWFAMEA